MIFQSNSNQGELSSTFIFTLLSLLHKIKALNIYLYVQIFIAAMALLHSDRPEHLFQHSIDSELSIVSSSVCLTTVYIQQNNYNFSLCNSYLYVCVCVWCCVSCAILYCIFFCPYITQCMMNALGYFQSLIISNKMP